MHVCVCAVMTTSDVTTASFSFGAKTSYPWRVELVFESPSEEHSRHRGRAKVDVCCSDGDDITCHRWRQVRYRRYSGSGRRYCIYDVTASVLPLWAFCRPKPCRLFHYRLALYRVPQNGPLSARNKNRCR